MIASNVNRETLEAAAKAVGGTIECNATSGSGRRFRVKLNPGEAKDENGDRRYQRISAFVNERRVAAICWHGFRDFFRAAFELEPDAVFHTAVEKWNGSDDFEERYQASGHRNCGSRAYPVEMAEACRCPDAGLAV